MIVSVLDACVLYPPTLRDLLMWLAAAMVFEPRWTEDIHAEWIRNVLVDNSDITPAQLERTRRLMDQVSENSCVTGYDKHIPALILPDPDDRHVLAAAIEANASVIVTFNVSDFPVICLEPHHVQAMHPDEYLVALLDDAAELFLLGVKDHRASLKRPPKSVGDYLDNLKMVGLPKLASRLNDHQDLI